MRCFYVCFVTLTADINHPGSKCEEEALISFFLVFCIEGAPHWAILAYKSSATSRCQKWKMKQESAARMRAQPLHLSIIKGLGGILWSGCQISHKSLWQKGPKFPPPLLFKVPAGEVSPFFCFSLGRVCSSLCARSGHAKGKISSTVGHTASLQLEQEGKTRPYFSWTVVGDDSLLVGWSLRDIERCARVFKWVCFATLKNIAQLRK